MRLIFDYLKQLLPQPKFGFQPSFPVFNSVNESTKLGEFQSFFVARDFSKQASYFFRVDSSSEYGSEIEEVKAKKPISNIELNYSVGLKRIVKILVFPVVFCWIVVKTAFEFIVEEDEISVEKEKVNPVSKENSYQIPK